VSDVRRLTLRDDRDTWKRFAIAMSEDPRQSLCGVVCAAGPNGEPLACAYLPNHHGAHSWATLPTWGRATDQADAK
jgi:hypothetical protein